MGEGGSLDWAHSTFSPVDRNVVEWGRAVAYRKWWVVAQRVLLCVAKKKEWEKKKRRRKKKKE